MRTAISRMKAAIMNEHHSNTRTLLFLSACSLLEPRRTLGADPWLAPQVNSRIKEFCLAFVSMPVTTIPT
jgi:hypothetical protein